jgi:hypothetical protein
MWEKTRVDGSRKLKYNAVPTIFGDRVVKDHLSLETMVLRFLKYDVYSFA